MTSELTPKQVKFVNEYLVDHNATAAARRAGYSARTANVQAAQLLSNTKVKKEIVARQEKTSEELNLTKNMLLLELSRIAFANPAELIHCLQTGKSIEGINLRFLRSLSVSNTGWSIATVDKISAIELLMKYLGFDSKPISNENNSDDEEKKETPLQAIQRIIAERAKRETEEESNKTSATADHPSSL